MCCGYVLYPSNTNAKIWWCFSTPKHPLVYGLANTCKTDLIFQLTYCHITIVNALLLFINCLYSLLLLFVGPNPSPTPYPGSYNCKCSSFVYKLYSLLYLLLLFVGPNPSPTPHLGTYIVCICYCVYNHYTCGAIKQ